MNSTTIFGRNTMPSNNLTPDEIEELRKDKQHITQQSDKLFGVFEESNEQRPNIQPISSNWED